MYYKYSEQSDKVTAFLKNGPDDKGVLSVDIFGLKKEGVEGTPTEEALAAPLGLKMMRCEGRSTTTLYSTCTWIGA